MHFIASLLPVLGLGALFVDAAPAPNPDPAWYLAPTTTTTTVAPHRSTLQERQSALSASSAAAASSSSAAASSSTTTPSPTKFYLAPTTFITSVRPASSSSRSSVAGPSSATAGTRIRTPLHLRGSLHDVEVTSGVLPGVYSQWVDYPSIACTVPVPAVQFVANEFSRHEVWVSEKLANAYGGLDKLCGKKVNLSDASAFQFPAGEWTITGGIAKQYIADGIAVPKWLPQSFLPVLVSNTSEVDLQFL
ncbi:hypothetical protein JCM8097_008228 [Rhodosporidiobolus ruineniae]